VSFVDAVLLMAASPRPIVFVMDLAKAIPIATKAEDPAAYAAAFTAAGKVLSAGDMLAIFPEGGITKDGTLQEFKGGIMKILEQAKLQGIEPPVIPMALTNLWGSYFSRIEKNGAMVRPFRRGLLNAVGLNVGSAIPANAVSPDLLKARVAGLLV
jgi:1-acyl-sn-glycerol-3-phosphate acyltransferase